MINLVFFATFCATAGYLTVWQRLEGAYLIKVVVAVIVLVKLSACCQNCRAREREREKVSEGQVHQVSGQNEIEANSKATHVHS